MSHINQAAFAPAGGSQELSVDEAEMVNGGGFFETLGEAYDNPATTIGRIIDYGFASAGPKGYYANGVYNIK
jgi:hypothetical protein